jgi:hypothetical protein
MACFLKREASNKETLKFKRKEVIKNEKRNNTNTRKF